MMRENDAACAMRTLHLLRVWVLLRPSRFNLSAYPSAVSAGLETFGFEHAHGVRSREKLDQRPGCLRLIRSGEDARLQHAVDLQRLRQRAHKLDAGNGHEFGDLLHGELCLAAC